MSDKCIRNTNKESAQPNCPKYLFHRCHNNANSMLITFLLTAVTKVVRTYDVRIDVISYVFHLSKYVLLGFHTLPDITFRNRNNYFLYILMCVLYTNICIQGPYRTACYVNTKCNLSPSQVYVNWYSTLFEHILLYKDWKQVLKQRTGPW